MNTLHSCNYFSSLVCWLVFTDGLFGNVLVFFFAEHIKEGREEYPAKLLNAHQTNYFKWLQVYPKGHFISSGYNALLQIFKNTKSELCLSYSVEIKRMGTRWTFENKWINMLIIVVHSKYVAIFNWLKPPANS